MRGGAASVAYCHGSLEPILPRLHLADFVVLLMLNWNTFYLRGTPGCIPIFSSDSTTAQMLVVKKYGSMIISGGCTWLAFDCPDANTSAPTHEWSAQFPPSGIWIHLDGLPIELPMWENSSHCLPTADAANPSIFQQRMVVWQLGNSCLVFYGWCSFCCAVPLSRKSTAASSMSCTNDTKRSNGITPHYINTGKTSSKASVLS